MALRMAEYSLRIYRQFRSFPKQIVLYVGAPVITMPGLLQSSRSAEPEFSFRYKLIDIRDLNTDLLLDSPHIEDNLLAILTRFENNAGLVRRILGRIAELPVPARRAAFQQFLIISGLRRLEPLIKEEAEKMPILNDIMDHQVIGPAIRQGLELGKKEGLKEGLEEGLKRGRDEGRSEGRSEGRRELLRRQLEKRFGALPNPVESRLADLSAAQLDDMGLRVLDATGLDEFFPAKQ